MRKGSSLKHLLMGAVLACLASVSPLARGASCTGIDNLNCFSPCVSQRGTACYDGSLCTGTVYFTPPSSSCGGGGSTTGGVPEVPAGAIGPLTLAAAGALLWARRRFKRGRAE